jgi:DNA processing protein
MAAKPRPQTLSDAELFDWLRLVRSENVGPRTFRALLDRFGGARAALEALPELARRGGARRPIRLATREEVELELATARRLGVRFVASGEPDYPPLLCEIDSAPPLLACRGRLEALRQPAVAIVGSRNASAAGLTFADRLARGLGRAGYVVVSGLARGIDQRAHAASLETGSVGVLAGGHAKPYPGEAVPLIERMLELGAVASEMPIAQEPRGRDFPRRNRIVSGLALGTIVVEAARGSGSLITARFALEQNRQVFAVPGSPLDPRAEGTNDLLKQGATICTCVEDVAAALQPMRSGDLFAALEESVAARPEWRRLAPDEAARGPAGRRPSDDLFDPPRGRAEVAADRLDDVRDRIAALLGPSPIALDDLAHAADASARETRIALMELELAGRIEFSAGDRVAAKISGEAG